MRELGSWIGVPLVTAITLAIAVWDESTPRDPHVVAALFPPWWTSDEVLSAAASAGDIVAPGGVSFVIAVRSDDADLASRIRAAGALLVLDRSAFGLCLPRGLSDAAS